MNFSGFCSQGDGASFSGYVNDWNIVLLSIDRTELIPFANPNNWHFSTTNGGHYCHSGTMRGSLEVYLPDNPYCEEDEPLQYDAWEIKHGVCFCDATLEKELQTYFRDLADKLYKDLETEHDYLTSDEYVVERLLEDMTDEELKDPDEEEEDTDETTEHEDAIAFS